MQGITVNYKLDIFINTDVTAFHFNFLLPNRSILPVRVYDYRIMTAESALQLCTSKLKEAISIANNVMAPYNLKITDNNQGA